MAVRGRGRPRNPKITRMMAEGIPRRTAFYRLKVKRKARLAAAARMGNGLDPVHQHREGYYPTPPRGPRALLAVEPFHGVLWECACGDGDISEVLVDAGFEVISTDLIDRGYGIGNHNFLTDHTTLVDHVITNPPYGPERGLTTRFVAHALTRIRPGGTVCMLLPINWEAAQRNRHLMAKCPRRWTFSRRLAMHRGDHTGPKRSPQLNVAWYVFTNEHTGPTLTVVLPPECGEVPLARPQEAATAGRGAG
jgi:hypothetical protein